MTIEELFEIPEWQAAVKEAIGELKVKDNWLTPLLPATNNWPDQMCPTITEFKFYP